MERTPRMTVALDSLLERYANAMEVVWKKKLTLSQRRAIIALALRYWNLREGLRETGQYQPLTCVCKIDRLVLTTRDLNLKPILGAGGYHAKTLGPKRLWKQNYSLAWRLTGSNSIREVVIASEPTAPWFAPYRVTIIPKDSTGIQPEDLRPIWEVLVEPKITLLEIAWDFPADCLVDLAYVQQFGLFGKTRFVPSSGNPFHQKCGSTGSKLVRAYVKWELFCFRIELELHTQFLRRHGINQPSDFWKLAYVLAPDHVKFAQISGRKLARSLQKRPLSVQEQEEILATAKRKARTRLWTALRYLRQEPARLQNVQRNLDGIKEVNGPIRMAAEEWARQWREWKK